MDTISSTAARLARYWAEGRGLSPALIRGLGRQVQDHLEHGADLDHLTNVVRWMAMEHPHLHDIDLAMRYRGAPRPAITARSGHPCLCRGGHPHRGGAPAPAIVRQLIRRPNARPAHAA
ncbi:hypothetical protein [Streptomyces sp. NPDC047939]|uniref:hypothetical protein n=1 Tax=Streptomyces sp. NPDC047939 TaxID=3155381 RepID=UPI00344ADAE1